MSRRRGRNAFFTYTGETKAGKRHGRGRLAFGDGGWIEGSCFVDGEIRGKGYRSWPNGDSYSGSFVAGERHGAGVMIYADGSQYEGEWQLNTRAGFSCVLKFPDGGEYVGDFAADRRHGDGVMLYPDGSRYEGPWVRGVPHGRGRLTTAAGDQIIESEWVDGVARSGPAGRAVSAGPSAAPTLDTPAASAVGHTQGRPHALPSGTGGAALDLATAPATAPATAHATDATDRSRVTVGSVGAGASLAAEIMATPEA